MNSSFFGLHRLSASTLQLGEFVEFLLICLSLNNLNIPPKICQGNHMFPLGLSTLRHHCLPLPNVQHHETVLLYILSIFLIVDGGSINAAPVFPHLVEAEMRHILF